ncbi:MAG: hypothetical protein V4605_08560 [Pseudomonadota bacterium]
MTEFDQDWAEIRRKHQSRRAAIVFSIGFIFWVGLMGTIILKVS